MRRHAVLLLVALGGCVPDQSKDMVACQSEVERFYPAYVASNMDDPGVRYIMACMESKGYAFSVSAADCDSKYPLPVQGACYTPESYVAAALGQFRWLKSK
jgi:hypothetical protein